MILRLWETNQGGEVTCWTRLMKLNPRHPGRNDWWGRRQSAAILSMSPLFCWVLSCYIYTALNSRETAWSTSRVDKNCGRPASPWSPSTFPFQDLLGERQERGCKKLSNNLAARIEVLGLGWVAEMGLHRIQGPSTSQHRYYSSKPNPQRDLHDMSFIVNCHWYLIFACITSCGLCIPILASWLHDLWTVSCSHFASIES